MTLRLASGLLLGTIALSACGPGERSPDPRLTVDNEMATLPTPTAVVGGTPRPTALDEKLALFRQGLKVPDTLSGGSPTREALIQRFVTAVRQRDTAAVRAMVLDRAEFAWLYYPSSPYTQEPTIQEAPLAWFLVIENSQKGITRVFNRFGALRSVYRGHRCDPEPSQEERNRFWGGCVVTLRMVSGQELTLRLFGGIIERDGRFKFLSYSNDF